MSVTFSAGKSILVRSTCDYGLGMEWECSPERRCGYCQDGVMEEWRSPSPEFNVANATARALFEALGRPFEDLIGSIAPGEIPHVRRRIVRALSTSLPERASVSGGTYGGPGTGYARVIDCGVDADRIRDRLMRFDALLAWAQERRVSVVWS